MPLPLPLLVPVKTNNYNFDSRVRVPNEDPRREVGVVACFINGLRAIKSCQWFRASEPYVQISNARISFFDLYLTKKKKIQSQFKQYPPSPTIVHLETKLIFLLVLAKMPPSRIWCLYRKQKLPLNRIPSSLLLWNNIYLTPTFFSSLAVCFFFHSAIAILLTSIELCS